MKPKVYIAGPYTTGDRSVNVRNAIKVADFVVECGGNPFVPHLSHFWDLITPRPYEVWLALVSEWISSCRIFYRILGESPGANIEEGLAKEYGLKMCNTLQELEETLKSQ